MKFIFIEFTKEEKQCIVSAFRRYLQVFFFFCTLGVISFYIFSNFKSCRYFFGTVLGMTGVFARLGWGSQTWDGVSMAENLDKWLFWICSVVSFFLLISA